MRLHCLLLKPRKDEVRLQASAQLQSSTAKICQNQHVPWKGSNGCKSAHPLVPLSQEASSPLRGALKSAGVRSGSALGPLLPWCSRKVPWAHGWQRCPWVTPGCESSKAVSRGSRQPQPGGDLCMASQAVPRGTQAGQVLAFGCIFTQKGCFFITSTSKKRLTTCCCTSAAVPSCWILQPSS